MEIIVNGQNRKVTKTLTMNLLLEELGLDAARVAIEHNRAIVPRERFAETTLADGDRVEVVQFVGGG